MDSTILSRRDLAFMLYEWLDAEALTKRSRFADHNRETFDAALDTAERLATELFARTTRSPTSTSRMWWMARCRSSPR
jgi:butyryl-CoA dehydrogenase